jgi:hypothetical protein
MAPVNTGVNHHTAKPVFADLLEVLTQAGMEINIATTATAAVSAKTLED